MLKNYLVGLHTEVQLYWRGICLDCSSLIAWLIISVLNYTNQIMFFNSNKKPLKFDDLNLVFNAIIHISNINSSNSVSGGAVD